MRLLNGMESPIQARRKIRMSLPATLLKILRLHLLKWILELFFREAIKELLNGNSVRAGRYGNFRIAFRSEGVEDINEFNANSMIKDARIVFQPSKLFRSEVINKLQFTVNCVTEDEVKYASLSDYRRAKGISGGGSGSDKPSGGGSGGGLDENPLG
ncbi:hypothetical protein [Bacteroides cellulosilyticus]|nr:hypothetical protein [Bacteroides cellulosilyticus]